VEAGNTLLLRVLFVTVLVALLCAGDDEVLPGCLLLLPVRCLSWVRPPGRS